MQEAIKAGDYATELTLQKEVEYNKLMADKGLTFVDVDKNLFKEASAKVYDTMGWADLKAKIDAQLGQ